MARYCNSCHIHCAWSFLPERTTLSWSCLLTWVRSHPNLAHFYSELHQYERGAAILYRCGFHSPLALPVSDSCFCVPSSRGLREPDRLELQRLIRHYVSPMRSTSWTVEPSHVTNPSTVALGSRQVRIFKHLLELVSRKRRLRREREEGGYEYRSIPITMEHRHEIASELDDTIDANIADLL
eukprot:3086989-Rhodomonas_salina.1